MFATFEQARDSVKAAANGCHGYCALPYPITPSRMPILLTIQETARQGDDLPGYRQRTGARGSSTVTAVVSLVSQVLTAMWPPWAVVRRRAE